MVFGLEAQVLGCTVCGLCVNFTFSLTVDLNWGIEENVVLTCILILNTWSPNLHSHTIHSAKFFSLGLTQISFHAEWKFPQCKYVMLVSFVFAKWLIFSVDSLRKCSVKTLHLIIFTNLVRHLYYFLRTLHFTVKQLLAKCRVGHAFF